MKLLPTFPIFIILIFSVPVVKAQELFFSGSRSQALAGTSTALPDCWSVFGNQAGLATANQLTVGGTFQNRFLVKELSINSGFVVLPIQSSVFGFSVYQFGKNNFRNEKFGVAYARSLTPKLHFGIQFNYYRFFLAEENRATGNSGMELGFQFRPNRQIILGIHILNPYKTSIKTFSGEYSYPSRFNIGLYYMLSESLAFISELEKDIEYPMNTKAALEYNIMEKLFIRTGISGKPFQLTGGMGFAVKKLEIDMAVAYNQYLGNSPSISFQYQF